MDAERDGWAALWAEEGPGAGGGNEEWVVCGRCVSVGDDMGGRLHWKRCICVRISSRCGLG